MTLEPDDLPPGADASDLERIAALLAAARPRPSAGFRGALRRRTLASGDRLRARPPHLRRRVAGCLVSGAALVLLAASGLTGRGPLAPPASASTVGHAGWVAQVR